MHRHRQGDAGATPALAHLLPAQVLRLSVEAQPRDRRQPRAVTLRAGLPELRVGLAFSATSREEPRGFSGEPVRARALPHVFQVVHRKGVGRSVRGDQRRVRGPAHQGLVAAQGGAAHAKAGGAGPFAPRNTGDRDEPDRALPVSQVRPRTTMGRSRRAHSRRRGGTPDAKRRRERANRRRARHGGGRPRSANESDLRSGGRLRHLDHAGVRSCRRLRSAGA